MGCKAVEIVLSAEEEAELKRWRRRRNTSVALDRCADVILDCARRYSGEGIAERHAWHNLVERFFATLTAQQLRRGTQCSASALEKAIRHYVDNYNEEPKPFRWTISAI